MIVYDGKYTCTQCAVEVSFAGLTEEQVIAQLRFMEERDSLTLTARSQPVPDDVSSLFSNPHQT